MCPPEMPDVDTDVDIPPPPAATAEAVKSAATSRHRKQETPHGGRGLESLQVALNIPGANDNTNSGANVPKG